MKTKATDKHVFAVTFNAAGEPCGLARVDTLDELVEIVERDAAKKLETRIRRMNLAQVSRVVERILKS